MMHKNSSDKIFILTACVCFDKDTYTQTHWFVLGSDAYNIPSGYFLKCYNKSCFESLNKGREGV